MGVKSDKEICSYIVLDVSSDMNKEIIDFFRGEVVQLVNAWDTCVITNQQLYFLCQGYVGLGRHSFVVERASVR